MLSLFTIKKILFFGTVGSGVLGPIIATSPVIREFTWSSDISPLKEGLTNWNLVDIYEGESISSFFKKALMYKEGQDGLIESFSQELAKQWYFSQPDIWTSQQREEWKKLQEKQFKDAWEHLKPKNPQRDFWDNYWGSRESMLSFWLRHNSHKLVKSFLTEFDRNDFSLNNSFEKDKEYNGSEDLTGLFNRNSSGGIDLEKSQQNWSKIGFFPTKSLEKLQDKKWEKFIWGKYQFINWSYKKWFEKNLPTYFWKVSWFYDKNSTTKTLEEKYSKKNLGINFPGKTNYFFPIFSEKTNKNFQEFIKKISNDSSSAGAGAGGGSNGEDLKLEDYFVEGWNGEQASTSTLLDVLNSFNDASPEYASASSYLVSKIFNESGGSGSPSPNSQVNKLELQKQEGSQNGDHKDPISIFFNSENGQQSGEQSSNTSISFEADIFVSSQDKKHKQVYDARETDSNWIFFRDDEGVHALALDGHRYLKKQPNTNNGKTQKDKLFNWFNFRNLQSKGLNKNWSTNKKFLSLSEKEDWFTRFFEYFTKNFDGLFAEYYIEKGDKSLLFNGLKRKDYFDNFKDSLSKIFSLRVNNELHSKLFDLRKKIIDRYSSRDWTNKRDLKSEKSQGLAAPFPYEINLNEDNKGRFPGQEKIFSEFLKKEDGSSVVAVKANASPEEQKYKESDYSKMFTHYSQTINKLIGNEKINLKIRSDGFDFQNSQRLFINDSIFDYLLDKLFANKDVLNHQIKEKKLLEGSLFNGNGMLKESQGDVEDNLPWPAPIAFENKANEMLQAGFALTSSPPQSLQAKNTWECSGHTFDKEKIKENLRSLLNSLLRSYFFRTYLKGMKDNYFGFLADFPGGKPKDSQQNQQVQVEGSGTTRFSFLINDLFEKWRQSYLTDVKERDRFLDFLISLDFLTRKNFEKLKEILRGDLSSTTKYHYLFFESVSNGKNSEKEKKPSHERGIHPFLSSGKQDSKERISFENRSEARTFIRESWKTRGELSLENGNAEGKQGQETTTNKKEAMFNALLVEQDNLPNKKENLFNFQSLQELLKYIKNITNYSDFEKLVELLSKIQKNISSDFYKVEKIYVKNSQEKKIYLEEKKKLLIYQLLHTDKNYFYSSHTFENNEEQEIFKKSFDDLISEVSKATTSTTTTQVTTQASAKNNENGKHHLEEKFFKREMGIAEGGYFIQVSSKDFESDISLCNFFNLLPLELLSEFLMDQADRPLNKDKAQNHFFEAFYKLKPRDMKFKNHIDSKYVE